ncbi:MAG TPA: hypothetical protein VFT12_06765 [Thermoanaerobaculia bacterium]|nr:hypothetical protein [Thermoanaerobaculia bacterium]
MITYRKGAPLRIKRSAAPEPPWWFATAIAPYGPRRAMPIAIDYLDLRASWSERMDVAVAGNVRDELERLPGQLHPPLLIDAAEFAEVVFRRGEETLAVASEWKLPAMFLMSSRGDVPPRPDRNTILAAWPADLEVLETHAASLAGSEWGMVIPVMFPATTDLGVLDALCAIAAANGARFLAAIPIELDATAKQAMARSLTLPEDEETYQHLFHADLEPVHVATERHVAALAAGAGMQDFVVPPQWDQRSNWNAAVVLTLTATRMLAMHIDTEMAGAMARSARIVAGLEKPIARIAEAASLSIIEALDPSSVDILTDWVAGGSAAFVEKINARWRLRRDAGMGEG